jgi:formylglycine-generating enzyme required for sulfatase activity
MMALGLCFAISACAGSDSRLPESVGDVDAGGSGEQADGGRASEMVFVERSAGNYRVDATEVTQAQFADFLGCTSIESCAEAADAPCRDGGFDAVAKADHPVTCVSWDAAQDYCTWAGKRLCTVDELTPACESTWERISGGSHDIENSPDACVLAAYRDGEWAPPSASEAVGSAPDCRGTASPFDRVFDAIGNVEEWVSGCDRGLCILVGGSHTSGPHGNSCDGTAWRDLHPQWADPYYKFLTAGIRCCADGTD